MQVASKKKDKIYFLIILFLIIGFSSFKFYEYRSSKMTEEDVGRITGNAENIILSDKYKMKDDDGTYVISDFIEEIERTHTIIQEDRVFIFFEFIPKKGSRIHSYGLEMGSVGGYYGYAEIGKRRGDYYVMPDSRGLSCGDSSLTVERQGGITFDGFGKRLDTVKSREYILYGKILNTDIERMEFYDEEGVLRKTYRVEGARDYYFILLEGVQAYSVKCYDKDGKYMDFVDIPNTIEEE